MANYLVYWKTYWLDAIDNNLPGYDWFTHSRSFYEKVHKGDSIWVVISGDSPVSNEWRILERIVVSGVEKMVGPNKWRRHRFSGNSKLSQLFDIDYQPDLTAILWLLKFQSDKPIRTLNKKIGQALQSRGFRNLSEKDTILLQDYIKTLKLRSNKRRNPK